MHKCKLGVICKNSYHNLKFFSFSNSSDLNVSLKISGIHLIYLYYAGKSPLVWEGFSHLSKIAFRSSLPISVPITTPWCSQGSAQPNYSNKIFVANHSFTRSLLTFNKLVAFVRQVQVPLKMPSPLEMIRFYLTFWPKLIHIFIFCDNFSTLCPLFFLI